MNYLEQVDHYRTDVIAPLRGSYDELLSRGCAPRIAAATLRYIAGVYGPEEDVAQAKVARDYDISYVTLRKRRREIEDRAIEALRDAGELHYTQPIGGDGDA